MKVIIGGGHEIDNFLFLCKAIVDSGFTISEVVSGEAKGVDTSGERFALHCPINN